MSGGRARSESQDRLFSRFDVCNACLFIVPALTSPAWSLPMDGVARYRWDSSRLRESLHLSLPYRYHFYFLFFKYVKETFDKNDAGKRPRGLQEHVSFDHSVIRTGAPRRRKEPSSRRTPRLPVRVISLAGVLGAQQQRSYSVTFFFPPLEALLRRVLPSSSSSSSSSREKTEMTFRE